MLLFQFPDGQNVSADKVLYYTITYPNGTSGSLNWFYAYSLYGVAVGSSFVLPISTNNTLAVVTANLQAMMNVINNAIANGINGVVKVSPSAVTITGVIPTSFVYSTDSGVKLDVFGTNFYPGMANGTVWVEDGPTGQDSNGISFSVVYVDNGHIVATQVSNGDGQSFPGPCALYFQDVTGIMSNLIPFTTT